MPPSPTRKAEADRLTASVRTLVAKGLERQQIMERLGISKGHATRLIRAARQTSGVANP